MAEQIRHAAELMNAYRLPVKVEDAGDAAHEATPVCDRGRMPALLSAAGDDALL